MTDHQLVIPKLVLDLVVASNQLRSNGHEYGNMTFAIDNVRHATYIRAELESDGCVTYDTFSLAENLFEGCHASIPPFLPLIVPGIVRHFLAPNYVLYNERDESLRLRAICFVTGKRGS